MKSRFAFGPFVAVGVAFFLAVACTGQGEGQRCQLANGNDDCQDGLVCYAANLITLPGGGNSNADICCLVDRTQSTEDICKQATITPGSDSGIPDTGTPDTGTDSSSKDGATDGASDGSGDGASTDAAGDASADAPSDGG